ncbi:MAG: hypothetical protein LBG19_04420 [Prevotellaceae bacterium]|jgi:hypothetical protein|nr:hypothetical protein [Prevotellaceae bacterium]
MKGSILISVGKSLAMLIAVMGIVHNVLTFTPLVREGLECLSREELRLIIYMSLMCGTSLIVSGLVLFALLNKLEGYPILSTPILFAGGFSCLSGILSVIYMTYNPFAWINLLLGTAMFIITLRLKKLIG